MPWGEIDYFAVVGPSDLWFRIGLNLTLENQPLAIVFLLDRGFLGKGWREAIDLSVKINEVY